MDITSALYILIWPRVVVEMWGKCMNFDGDAFVFLVWPSASIFSVEDRGSEDVGTVCDARIIRVISGTIHQYHSSF